MSRKQNLRDEGKEKGLAEGHAEGKARGLAEGRAAMRAEILQWIREKEEAELEGREFNEPMPGAENNGTSPRRNGN